MEEATQGKKNRGKEGGREGGVTTRRGNRTFEFQPDFKTIQVGSKNRMKLR